MTSWSPPPPVWRGSRRSIPRKRWYRTERQPLNCFHGIGGSQTLSQASIAAKSGFLPFSGRLLKGRVPPK